ncbi:MAG: RNA methyltransferase [Verrucomicrobiota bacterium]
MLQVQKVLTLADNPGLQPYITLRRPHEHQQQGIFVAEGEKVVRRMLESNFPVISVLSDEKWLANLRPLLEARPETITVYLASKQMLESMVGFEMFQGILAVGKIPAPVSLAEVLKNTPRPLLLTAVDEIGNAENLGLLVRNCAAFHVQALLVGETSSSPFLRRAVRNSMGTIFQLPIVETKSLVESLRELKRHDVRCIAAHPHVSGRTLAQADFTGDCCVVLGNEGKGISPAVLAECDDAVAIPMPPKVDSLNVGAATAVFLYEANRQRGKI